MKKEIALVCMVAGISARFGGRIKAFAKIGPNYEYLIDYSLNQALKAGFDKLVFIISRKTEQAFRDYFKTEYRGIPVSYALQEFDEAKRDKPWGTADAVCSLNGMLNCPFVLCNGDDIYGENSFRILAQHLRKSRSDASVGYLLGKVLPEGVTANRGIFSVKRGYLWKIQEKLGINRENLEENSLSETSLANMNLFALHPETLHLLQEAVNKIKQEKEGDRKVECLLPVELSNLIESGKIKIKLYSTPDKWYGVTNPDDEEKVRQEIIAEFG